MSKVAEKIGFNLKIWENQGQPTQWVQGFDYAINNKFNLIDLMAGADPRFLGPQVKAAEGAGLKVVAAHLTGYEQPIPAGRFRRRADRLQARRRAACGLGDLEDRRQGQRRRHRHQRRALHRTR